ncbi:hypothetical protein [Phocoenobacter skyensis]|uniref:Uncharacterized protein n=1 Tax=Phocoenobacter skyensis TaxID=97481 RepID=A0A1H7XMM3_9PAST|nr:hypothetical protein [Pasteurella skyensis]MDP8184370.1 hypothetical protein [Pasteurella skyensis]QLB22623.1 hypothetical protein A6B44_05145 [Pasteurella skyensis]SEM34437.1 hypothetical protein SAMN05444853_11323 [Pasteurella skyensis]
MVLSRDEIIKKMVDDKFKNLQSRISVEEYFCIDDDKLEKHYTALAEKELKDMEEDVELDWRDPEIFEPYNYQGGIK